MFTRWLLVSLMGTLTGGTGVFGGTGTVLNSEDLLSYRDELRYDLVS